MKKLLLIFTFLFWLPIAHANDAEKRGSEAYWAGDYKTAYSILKPLAKEGHAATQIMLAAMYEYGNGVPKNYIMAYMWYSIAKASGFRGTTEVLEILAKSMTLEDVSKAQQLATQCWKSKYKKCGE